jgi:hypothetical protein
MQHSTAWQCRHLGQWPDACAAHGQVVDPQLLGVRQQSRAEVECHQELVEYQARLAKFASSKLSQKKTPSGFVSAAMKVPGKAPTRNPPHTTTASSRQMLYLLPLIDTSASPMVEARRGCAYDADSVRLALCCSTAPFTNGLYMMGVAIAGRVTVSEERIFVASERVMVNL